MTPIDATFGLFLLYGLIVIYINILIIKIDPFDTPRIVLFDNSDDINTNEDDVFKIIVK